MSAIFQTQVVLIGIDRYDHVSDTQGARQDVAGLWRVCVDQLQIPPENIVVVSPVALTPGELVGEVQVDRATWLGLAERSNCVAGARLDAIEAHLRKLAGQMRNGAVQGWVHLSAHGTRTGLEGAENLGICAENYNPDDGSGLLTFQTLQELFGVGPSAKRLTLSLDCCWTGDTLDGPVHPLDLDLPYRVMVGTSPDRVARVVRLSGVERGAFSWALATALSRWTRVQTEGQNALRVTYGDLVATTRDLLRAMGVSQVPTLTGPRDVDRTLVFRPRTAPDGGEVARLSPDLYLASRQIWAGETDIAYYNLGWKRAGDTLVLGVVTVDATEAPGIEVWTLRNDTLWQMLAAVGGSDVGSLEISVGSGPAKQGPQTVSWQLVQQLLPVQAESGAAASATVLYVHQGPAEHAILGLDFHASGDNFVIDSSRWSTSELATPMTFDPVQGASPTAYVGTTASQPLASGDWVWPSQIVDQLVQKPQ